MTHQKYKERLIPEQNKGLIAGICLCQLTVVLSLVSFMYLTVAIYIPSHKAFNSGFESTPVICQTIETTMINNCSWASCGEWCLTKTTGFCPQIHVTVRRNGTDITMENCTRLVTNACLEVKHGALTKYNCNNGSECSSLTGVFNCSLGHCSNMSDRYQCHYRADGIIVDSDKDNLKLNGFFECNNSRCTKIKKAFPCDRDCPKITTPGLNTFLAYGDSLYTGLCQRATATTEAAGREAGRTINATEFWTAGGRDREILMAYCQKVESLGNALRGIDCINGTVLPKNTFPEPFMNFTTFWSIQERSNMSVDMTYRFVPPQRSLTIYNHSRLYINLDGCVNTLKGECKAFVDSNGKDGRNKTAISSFPCFYKKTDSFMAIARFDLDKTWRELVIALIVPTILFVISFTTLTVVMRSVKVGDDTILRCSLCGTKKRDEDEIALARTNNVAKVTDNNGGAMVL